MGAHKAIRRGLSPSTRSHNSNGVPGASHRGGRPDEKWFESRGEADPVDREAGNDLGRMGSHHRGSKMRATEMN